MSDYKSLSPGSKCALLLSIAHYLRSFADFYDDILKNHPKELKDKYSKLPFLTLISERLIKEAEVYKLQDYQIDNHTVLDNDFLKIGLGYHDEMYHMLLLKSFVLMFGTDLKLETEFNYFQSSLDPLSVIPILISMFLEKHIFFLDSDLTFKAYEKMAFTFLKDYANSNELFKSHDNISLDGDMLVKAWLQFSRMQVKSYDSELVSKKVEEFRATGNKYHKEKHYTQAAISYTEGLKLNPNSYHLLANRGAVFSALNNGEAAVIDTEKAVKLQPSSISAWTRLAFNHLYTGRAVDSFTDYNNAILACYGRIFPLHLTNGSDYSQKKFTQSCMEKLNEKFIDKLCASMQFARTRAETQGYPLKYIDDLMDPVVKKVFEEHIKPKQGSSATRVTTSTTPSTNDAPHVVNPSVQPQGQPQVPNFGNVFTAISSNANGDFQQIFDAIHQQVTAQNGNNNNNGDAAQLGLSMLGNIVTSFMSGTQQGVATQSTEPAATNATATADSGTLRNTNENVEMGEAGDADPDIDLDDILQDNLATALPNSNVVVTSFGGSEMPTDVRDQISRVAGGIFNFFGERRRQTNANANPANGNDNNNNNNNNSNRQGGGDAGGDSVDHDLD